jgi:PP-loop superfamily ATP-utilizing enzyme
MDSKAALIEKLDRLQDIIRQHRRVLAAFSGGVDNTLSLAARHCWTMIP